jgi:hypothetical protein
MAIGKTGQSPTAASVSRPSEPAAKRTSAPETRRASSPPAVASGWAPTGKATGAARANTARPAPSTGASTGLAASNAAAAPAPQTQVEKDAAQLKGMKDLMARSPAGAEAIKYLDDQKIPVEFAAGGGSYWDGSKVVIDRNESTQSAGLTLVHELNHAKASKAGLSGNISTQPRDQYVSTMLNEEVTGTILPIKVKNELVAAGTPIAASFPLEAEYNTAHKAAVDELKASNPKATEAELKSAGEKAGFERVLKGFKDGEVVTSTNNTKYPDYYGGSWDRVHP